MFISYPEQQGLSSKFDHNALTKHGVILGGTGSGKTGLGLVLMEELVIAGVPIVAIDLKGDLGNFVQQSVALDSREYERAMILKSADVTIYTPGVHGYVSPIAGFKPDTCGVPLSMKTKGFGHNHSFVTGLLSLAYNEAIDFPDPRLTFFEKAMSQISHWPLDVVLTKVLDHIRTPDFTHVGTMTVDEFFPPAQRLNMLRRLTAVLESEDFKRWMSGREMYLTDMLVNPVSKQPRVSIISLAHLSEADKQFFLSSFLEETIKTMRAWEGSAELKAVLFIDECFGMLPPVANPPTKKHLLTLLKQARGYGLGVVLGTQNPGDLDYRALSNVGSWWVGRLTTDRDREKVCEGLRSTEVGLDLRVDIAELQPRQFIQAIHGQRPVKVRSKDVFCKLTGPMTLQQINKAMEWRMFDVEWDACTPSEEQHRRIMVKACRAAMKSLMEDLSALLTRYHKKPELGLFSSGLRLGRQIVKARMRHAMYDGLLTYQESGYRAYRKQSA